MPTYEGVESQAARGCLAKPLLLQILQDDDFPFEFTVHIRRPVWRGPDGWFHASTHPTASEKDLLGYIARPEEILPGQMGYIGKMSTMFGTFVGVMMAEALSQTKVWVPVPEGICPACGLSQPDECHEHGAIDPETLSRGHLDGILNFGSLGTYGWDCKTIKTLVLHKCPDMDLEFFRGKWPGYYGQMQEYMRLTGLRKFIVSFIGVGNPWTMKEYHVPFDPPYAAIVEQKYKRILAAYRSGREVW